MRAAIRQSLRQKIVRGSWLLVALLGAILIAMASPAVAHTDHKKKEAAAQIVRPGASGAATADPTVMHS